MLFAHRHVRLDINRRRALIGLTALALIVGGCTGAGASPDTAGEDLRVVATTTVFADLIEQVGGDLVTVTSLVPKGGVVETFDPTPADLRAVADADLIVMNGLGLDDWLTPVLEDSGTAAAIVVLAEDLPGVTYQSGDSPDEPANPHLWLNVRFAMRYVDRIVEGLALADPTNAHRYRSGGSDYLQRLEALDMEVTARINAIPASDRIIVSFHEAFPYLAAAYGLTIVGTIVDAPGQDPSAGEIAALVEAIRSSGAKAIFSEAQFDPELAQTVADEAGVVVETNLYNDSLGDAPVDTYEGLIRWDVDRIVAALTR
jgi:ABC-type Zn uptake system ZnuABC Zn-binding protein ZnuA